MTSTTWSDLAPLDPGVLHHVRGALLPHQLLAVLLTGSTSRGYALDGSDLDLMAFYRVTGEFTPYPDHGRFRGRRVTVEHHDVAGFLHRTADHGWHLGSLRQLLKVRDGTVVLGDSAAVALVREIAARAHLDPYLIVVLLARIRERQATARALPPAAAHQIMLGWVELLATLCLAARPRAAAYSKPKWLLRALASTGDLPSLRVLRALYPETDELAEALECLAGILSGLDIAALDDNERRLVETAAQDAREMARACPAQAWPAVRFAAVSAYRLAQRADPMSQLWQGADLPDPLHRAMGTPTPARPPAWAEFEWYAEEVATRLHSYRGREDARIGSTRLTAHLVQAYGATDAFPWMCDPAAVVPPYPGTGATA